MDVPDSVFENDSGGKGALLFGSKSMRWENPNCAALNITYTQIVRLMTTTCKEVAAAGGDNSPEEYFSPPVLGFASSAAAKVR